MGFKSRTDLVLSIDGACKCLDLMRASSLVVSVRVIYQSVRRTVGVGSTDVGLTK